MAEPHPTAFWRRLLALPADSQAKTIAMAFAVSAACAILVSGASVLLSPRIDANLAAERQAKLDELISSMPALADILEESQADTMETIVVSLETGLRAPDVDTPVDMQALAADPATSRELTPEQDFAGIGRRPDYAPINVLKSGGRTELVILPIYGAGYQSQIEAYLALEGDLNTVAGLAITSQGETPGLGAKISEPAWQALWPGKQIADDSGDVVLSVVRGKAKTEYEIDGITGATRTGNAISGMVRFWMGPNGYGPVLDALAEGEL